MGPVTVLPGGTFAPGNSPGTITVASRLGRGSIFTVVLPTAKEPSHAPEPSIADAAELTETVDDRS